MKTYRVIKPMILDLGHIQLTEDQADDFVGCLVELADVPGVYDIVETIEIDVGEIIGMNIPASNEYIKSCLEEEDVIQDSDSD